MQREYVQVTLQKISGKDEGYERTSNRDPTPQVEVDSFKSTTKYKDNRKESGRLDSDLNALN